jgi:hypothetical protein
VLATRVERLAHVGDTTMTGTPKKPSEDDTESQRPKQHVQDDGKDGEAENFANINPAGGENFANINPD